MENDDFDSFFDDDFDANETSSETISSSRVDDDDLDFDQLRRQSARTGAAYDDMDMDDGEFLAEEPAASSGFSLSNFTPGQRLILAVLVLLDILAIGFGVLVITGNVSL